MPSSSREYKFLKLQRLGDTTLTEDRAVPDALRRHYQDLVNEIYALLMVNLFTTLTRLLLHTLPPFPSSFT